MSIGGRRQIRHARLTQGTLKRTALPSWHCLRCLASLWLLAPRLVSASWQAVPLQTFARDGVESGERRRGPRRYAHSEHHRLEGGDVVALNWEVEADPDSLLSVDAEHPNGVKILSCSPGELVLYLPHERHQEAITQNKYQHVVASEALHRCDHLRGEHLYSRVLQVKPVENENHHEIGNSGGVVARFVTEELASPAQVLPYASFSFRYVPYSKVALETGPVEKSLMSHSSQYNRRLRKDSEHSGSTSHEEAPEKHTKAATRGQTRASTHAPTPDSTPAPTPKETGSSEHWHGHGASDSGRKQSAHHPQAAAHEDTKETSSSEHVHSNRESGSGRKKSAHHSRAAAHEDTKESGPAGHGGGSDLGLEIGAALGAGIGAAMESNVSNRGEISGFKHAGGFGPSVGGGPTSSQNIYNFIPREAGNFGFNMDFSKNHSKKAQFVLRMPGGQGHYVFDKPSVRAHASVEINYTSHRPNSELPPLVKVVATLDGHAFVSGDFAAVLGTVERLTKIHEYQLPLADGMLETTSMRPLEFYLGSVPVRLAPGARIGLNAYHKGKFKGSMRLGVDAHIKFKATLDFDTHKGLNTELQTDVIDSKLDAPTWLVWTKHFEMGALLDCSFTLLGSFGDVKNMQFEIDARPFVNASVQQRDAEAKPDVNTLAIFPFRALGLPEGEEFAVEVEANGRTVTTSKQLSSGATEFGDSVEKFNFGAMSEDDLLMKPITVKLVRHGKVFAKTSLNCGAIVDGECQPSPMMAKMMFNGTEQAVVELSILYQEDPVKALMSKMRSLSLVFPTLTIPASVAAAWNLQPTPSEVNSSLLLPFLFEDDQDAIFVPKAEFRVVRDGRAFNAPLKVNMTDKGYVTLYSDVTFQLGQCYLESWRHHKAMPNQSLELDKMRNPQLELRVNGALVAVSDMPAIPWDQADTLFTKTPTWHVFETDQGAATEKHGSIPLDFSLKPVGFAGTFIGTGRMHVVVEETKNAAFWVSPTQATTQTGEDVQLYWTVNGHTHAPVTFKLWAMEVQTDGSLKPFMLMRTFSSKCVHFGSASRSADPYRNIHEYCVYNVSVTEPRLRGHRISFLLQWWRWSKVDAMVSPPMDFIGDGESGSPSSSRRLRPGGSKHADADYQKKVDDIVNPKCIEEPLKYSVGFAMFMREQVRHVRLTKELALSLGAKSRIAPDFSTPWLPVPNIDQELAEFMRSSKCEEGVCQGELPGCPPSTESSKGELTIPHLRFKLSREIPWTADAPIEIRNIIAYGLALLPEAVQLQALRIKKSWRQWSPSSGAAHTDNCTEVTCPAFVCADGTLPPVEPGHCCGDKTMCPSTNESTDMESNASAGRQRSEEKAAEGARSSDQKTDPPTTVQATTTTTATRQMHTTTTATTSMTTATTSASAMSATQAAEPEKDDPESAASASKGSPAHHADKASGTHDKAGRESHPQGEHQKNHDADDRRLLAIQTSSTPGDGNTHMENVERHVMADGFEVRLLGELPFKADQSLADTLLARGAWRGISDGRDRAYGPVELTGVVVHHHPQGNGLATNYQPVGGADATEPEPIGQTSFLLPAACLCVASLALVTVSFGLRSAHVARGRASCNYAAVDTVGTDDWAQ